MNHPERKNYDISSLENAVIGGSTVQASLLAKMKSILNIRAIIVGYGMTETSFCHTVTTHTDETNTSNARAFESVGRPIPFTETKIVNSTTGHILPLNTDGELLIRGPHILREYWDEKEKTAQTIDKHGW
jgi:fatty-acyl-CoA synthase